MNTLLEIYNKLILTESPEVNSVVDAINNRYEVTINYEGDPEHGIAPGIRNVQIYAYGLTKAGNPVIRAYQPYGDTATKVPSWKFFRLDRITGWEKTFKLVTKPADGFNPNGDKSMSVVYNIVNFNKPVKKIPQDFKIVGNLPNIDKINKDRKTDNFNKKENTKSIERPHYYNKPSSGNQVTNPSNEVSNQDSNEEINKIKDLNKRIDKI